MARPNYKTNDPVGWCGDPSRGAAMGRPSLHADNKALPVKLYLNRVNLNGGYDSNGTYFGIGDPLFWVASADGSIDFMIRANNRDQAKDKISWQHYPNAKFWR